MYFHFCFCFFSWYFDRNYEFCNSIKILCKTAGIKKKKKKHDKIVLLAKSKLNRIEGLISKALIDSNISPDEFILINHLLKEYDDMKEMNLKF